MYIVGETKGSSFPVTNEFQSVNAGSNDVFISKLSPDGSQLLYSSYLGGGHDDVGYDIAVDTSGAVYIIGETRSTNLPTFNAIQPTKGDSNTTSNDAFMAKISPDGSTLVFCTYFGGSSYDGGMSVALDAAGIPNFGGWTRSPDMLTTNAYDDTFNGGENAFVAKFSPDGSNLLYSTYFGLVNTKGHGIAVNSSGEVYLVGQTLSITTTNAFQPAQGGGSIDGFLTIFTPNGTNLRYSTYLGGDDTDKSWKVAIGSSNEAYVAGASWSTNFPTQNPFQATNSSVSWDGTVTRFDETGTNLIYSTYFGSLGIDDAFSIAVADSGRAWVVGDIGNVTNFPLVLNLQSNTATPSAKDAFVAAFAPDGTLEFSSSPLGGTSWDRANAVAVDSNETVYIAGQTWGAGFPTVNPYQGAYAGSSDAFLSRITPDDPALAVGPVSLTFSTMLGSDPAMDTFTVTNVGQRTLIYTNTRLYGTGASNWLGVVPAAAALSAGSSLANDASVTVAGIPVGVYDATNTIDGNQTNAAQSIDVSLTVSNIPNPQSVSALADGPEMVRLAWAEAAGREVMIVHGLCSNLPAPVQGAAYSVGDSLGVAEPAGLLPDAGWWKFDETSGTTAADSSAGSVDGLVSNGADWVAGKFDNALDFDNSNSVVTLTNAAPLEDLQENSYSISAWFKPDTTPPGSGSDPDAAYAIVIKKGWHLGLSYNESNQFVMNHVLTGNSQVPATSTNAFAPGSYYHLVGIIDRTNGLTKIYVNGRLEATASWTAGTATREYGTEEWRIGMAHPYHLQSFAWPADGIIDDVRLYSRALTDCEAEQLYGATVIHNDIASGTTSNLEHIVQASSTNYYNFYAVNNSHYSTGIQQSVATDTYEPYHLVEAFSYTNGLDLENLDGGLGWTNAWYYSAGDTDTVATIVSGELSQVSGYPTNSGNMLHFNAPTATSWNIMRQFNEITNGDIYVSTMMNFERDGTGQYMRIGFFGSTSGLYISYGESGEADDVNNASIRRPNFTDIFGGYTINNGAGEDYLLIGYYNFETKEAKQKMYYKTDTVPVGEPATWDITTTVTSVLDRFDRVMLFAGSNAGTTNSPGNVYYDEIRIATSWNKLIEDRR